jgi:Copper transport outer membrane protein, MctB
MINFRFHIASLIAVFLALALGVVMGSTVVQRAIVDTLRQRIDDVERHANTQNDRNDALSAENDRLNLYVAESAPYAVRGALTDQSVAVLAERGIDEDAVKAQVALLQTAGARVGGILWLESAWNLTDKASADALRTATGSTTRNDRTLRSEALDALALRLAQGAAAGGADVLDNLAKGGFVNLEGPANADVTAASFPGTGSRILLLGGPGSTVTARGTALELTRSLVAANAPTVVGEVYQESDGAPDRGTWLAPIRSDDQLATAVSTVDDVDLVQGRVASALALGDLAQGVVGSYGYGVGAKSVLPPAAVPVAK